MSGRLISSRLQGYIDSLVPARSPEMQAMEAYAQEKRFPIVGPAAGHLGYQIARMIGARRIFELGSGYGYSTAWFAQAVKENGGGRIFDERNQDANVRGVREFTKRLMDDPGWISTLVPIHDGLIVAYKR